MTKLKSIFKNRIFIYSLLFRFSIFLASCCKDYDYDLYARFIIAENFFEKGVFNYNDFLSYTPTHTWYDHEYGAGLIYYLFYKYLGPCGLVLIQGLLLFITAFIITKIQQLQKHAYPISLLCMCIFLMLFARQNPSIIRCHMFSFVFFALFMYFLEKTRIGYLEGKPSKILWLVPPLVILWNNLHGGIFSGLGLIAMYMVGALLTKQNWKIYLQVIIVSVPLLVITPYGPEYIDFLFSASTKNRSMITEWWGVFGLDHSIYYYPLFLASILGVFLALTKFWNQRKLDITKFIVLASTLYLGTIHVKLLSFPIIVLWALYYNDIMQLFDKNLFKKLEKFAYPIVICAILFIPFKHPEIHRTSITKFPVKEVEFIKINNIKGNLLTEFGLGSYVSYKLYPDNLIYMDGRYEVVYNDKEFDNLMNFEKKENDWQTVLRDYPTEILLMEKTIPIYETLEKLPNWVKIYEGDLCGVFVKKSKAKKHYKTPNDDINYYRENEFTNKGFFRK